MVKKRCFIISAAPASEKDIELVNFAVKADDFVMVADAGYETAMKAGLNIDLFVGDCDSISDKTSIKKCKKIILSTEKDDTDTLFCAKQAIEMGFDEVCILCALSGRYDHMLANLSVLLYLERNGIQALAEDISCKLWVKQAGSRLSLKEKSGCVVSVLPFACESCTLSGSGFKYNIKNTEFLAHTSLGVSNEVVENTANLNVCDGCTCIILNKNSNSPK